MLQKSFSSAEQLVCQCSCERKKILRDNQLWFGAADCVRNPFKIRNPHVPYVWGWPIHWNTVANMWTDRRKNTVHTNTSRILCAAFSTELKASNFSYPLSPDLHRSSKSGSGRWPKHKHSHINTPHLLNHSPYLLRGHSAIRSEGKTKKL